MNLAFLARTGWNQAIDRVRLHTQFASDIPPDHPLAQMLGKFGPHLLIRRLDREEDHFAAVQVSMQGEISILSNDALFAHSLLRGIFLECPPSFHTSDDLEVSEGWRNDDETRAVFAGMLMGALGWDPSHNIPHNIQQSLDEAKHSLEIANFRASVVMSRRTLEAVMKFGYERLLKKKPLGSSTKSLVLNDIIQESRNQKPCPIPEHLLHVVDSVRVLGNVPGAHAADIKDYHFSRADAELALYATAHFLDQYFAKIDPEVTQYYVVTIDIPDRPEAPVPQDKDSA